MRDGSGTFHSSFSRQWAKTKLQERAALKTAMRAAAARPAKPRPEPTPEQLALAMGHTGGKSIHAHELIDTWRDPVTGEIKPC